MSIALTRAISPTLQRCTADSGDKAQTEKLCPRTQREHNTNFFSEAVHENIILCVIRSIYRWFFLYIIYIILLLLYIYYYYSILYYSLKTIITFGWYLRSIRSPLSLMIYLAPGYCESPRCTSSCSFSRLNGVTISGNVIFCAIDLGTPTYKS